MPRTRKPRQSPAATNPPITVAVSNKEESRGRVLTLADINGLRRRRTGTAAVRVGRLQEFGASGTLNVFGKIYSEDYNTLFDGENGIIIYDQMYKSDSDVGSATDIMTSPIRSAKWRCVPTADEANKATPKEKEICDRVNECLYDSTEWPVTESWDFILRHLLLRVPYGFGLLEQVWRFDEDLGLLRWKRFAPRLPRTVKKFNVAEDGILTGIEQYVSRPGTGIFEQPVIPMQYALLSVRDREGDNYFGKSIYRRSYKHWFYKDECYRIDAVRLDRYGVGVPVAKIEEGHVLEADELDEIELTLQALRSHERAYIIEPPKVSFRIMVPEGGHGGALGLMDSVKHHSAQIVRSVLATFLSDHSEGLNTNRTQTLADIFMFALKAEHNAIAHDIDTQAIKQFCDYNFDMTDARYPHTEVTGIGELGVEALVKLVGEAVTGKIVQVDDSIEGGIRESLGLDPMPEYLARPKEKPQVAVPGAPTPGDPNNPTPPEPVDPEEEPSDVRIAAASLPALVDGVRALAQAHEAMGRDLANVKDRALIPPKPVKKTIKRDAGGRIESITTE